MVNTGLGAFKSSMQKWVWALAFFATSASGGSFSLLPDVERILMQMTPPDGVVLEVESLSGDAMSGYTQLIQTQVDALKQRYPDMDVVIISHGRELVEFAKPQADQPPSDLLHTFETMVNTQDVTIHVCGVVAGWEGKSDQDFVDYVDVSASGEAQLNDYRAIGYDVIIVERLSDEERHSLQPQD